MEDSKKILREYVKILLEDDGGSGDVGMGAYGDVGGMGKMDQFGFTTYTDSGTLGKSLFGPFKDALTIAAGEAKKTFAGVKLAVKTALGSALSIIPGIKTNWGKVFSDYESQVRAVKSDPAFSSALKNVYSVFQNGDAAIFTMLWNPAMFFTTHAAARTPGAAKSIVDTGKELVGMIGKNKKDIGIDPSILLKKSEEVKEQYQKNIESFIKGAKEISGMSDQEIINKFFGGKIDGVKIEQPEKDAKDKSKVKDEKEKLKNKGLQILKNEQVKKQLADQVRNTFVERLNQMIVQFEKVEKESRDSFKEMSSKKESLKKSLPNFEPKGSKNDFADYLKSMTDEAKKSKNTFLKKMQEKKQIKG